MKVKELIKLLKTLDQDATIDMSSDEEGNTFGDIDTGLGDGFLLDHFTGTKGGRVYTLYPVSSQDPSERYFDEEE